MAKKNDCWGIEVGANALKAIRLVRRGNDVNVAEYDMLPFKKVLTTPDLNVDEAIEVQLDTFLARHQVSKSTVMVSVPASAAFQKFAKLPPVDPRKIPEMVRFEALQQIPFPMDEVEWDYQVFSSPDSPDTSVGIVAITKEKVNQFLKNYREVGLTVDGLTLSPLAVYNALVYDMNLTPESPGTIMMDIGTSNTDLIIYENGQIWMRRMQIGGNNFTDALMRAFKLGFSKAERLKREAGTSKYARQIFQAMRPVFADLVQEIQRSLGYYQSINREANLTRLVGVGSTFRLRGIQKFLKQQLQMEVIKPDGFKRLQIEGPASAEFVENSINFCTAYGLALQGLDLESVDINIMPREILKQRLWKSKQPMFIVTAASLVAAAGVSYAKLKTVEFEFDKNKETNDKIISPIESKARSFVDEWKTTVSVQDPRQRIANLQRILDYRDVWPKLLADIDDAQGSINPQPVFRGVAAQNKEVYLNIQSILRTDRQKMYIESLSSKYRFATYAAAGTVAPAPAAAAPTSFDINGPVRPGGRTLGKPPAGPAGAGVTGNIATGSSWPNGGPSPLFDLVIKGTIPSQHAPTLIGKDFLFWLQANSIRPGRPYRILIAPDTIVYLATKTASGGGGGGGGAGGGGGGGGGMTAYNGGFPTAPVAPQRPPGGAASPWATAGGAGPAGAGPAGSGANRTLQPNTFFQRPLMHEPNGTDYVFEIKFTIELVQPSEFRLAPQVVPGPGGPGAKTSQIDTTTPSSLPQGIVPDDRKERNS
jgi:type IV pilus assembly protein PilM